MGIIIIIGPNSQGVFVKIKLENACEMLSPVSDIWLELSICQLELCFSYKNLLPGPLWTSSSGERARLNVKSEGF